MKIGKPRVLNVDDNDGSRYAVRRVLEIAGFDVGDAGSGAEALRLARETLPDIVLLDINLPDYSGFEVCRRLKASPETAAIPVMHITASYSKASDQVNGLEAGAEAYLVEPVEPDVLVATIRAILRARHAEDLARGLAREWETTFDAMRDGVALVDAKGRMQRCNESFARVLGRTQAELAGFDCSGLWSSAAPEAQPFPRAMANRKRESAELEYNGRLLSIVIDPIFEDDGRAAGGVLIVSDITEHHKLEEQFREAQKFETVGTLAAGVAHDFNNLLTSIMGNASLAQGDLDEKHPLSDKLGDIIRAGQRAADLTSQLLAYSGKGRHFPQKLKLSSVLGGMKALVEAGISKKIRVEWNLTANLPEIEADANQLQQVLMNLVTNSSEAIGDAAGRIMVTTAMDKEGCPFLEVADNGCGMDAETKARIFDPFFTTKFTGRGLGLAAVAGIARGHKASIEVTSQTGEGCAFRVTFPCTIPTKAPPVAPGAERPEKVTVLVVDDEDMVRRIAKASLEIRGYRVLLATNGLEAIQMAQKHPEIEVVLLDLTMPVMSGEEAIDDIVAALPSVRVVVSTGYDHRETAARFARKRVHGFLHKPYTSKQLSDVVASMAGREAKPSTSYRL
jgi:PAS domain S-box-containing protein